MLEKADQILDLTERTTYLLKAERILMDAMPIIPIYFYTGSYLKKSYVKDVYLSVLSDSDFKWAYVDIKK
jgi:oligopeptide transport system substrate-binding protein